MARPGDDAAHGARYIGGALAGRKPGAGVLVPVERDHAHPQQGEPFGSPVPSATGGGDGLIEVGEGGGLVASLGGIPDELAHQGRGFSFCSAQIAPHIRAARMRAEEADLAQALPGLGDQGGGRRPVVLLIEAADLLTQVRHCHQISACRVGKGIAEPLLLRTCRLLRCGIAMRSAVGGLAGAHAGTASRPRPGRCLADRAGSIAESRRLPRRCCRAAGRSGVCSECAVRAEQPVQARRDPGGKGLAAVSRVGQVALAASSLAGRRAQGDAAFGQDAVQLAAEVSHRSSPITGAGVFPCFPGHSRDTGNSFTLPRPRGSLPVIMTVHAGEGTGWPPGTRTVPPRTR